MTFAGKLLILIMILPWIVVPQSDSTGIKLIGQRKYKEAQTYFEAAIARDGQNAEARYYRALTLMIQQQLDDAEDEIDEAIDLNDQSAKYHLLRGQILGQQAMGANIVSQGFLAPKIKNAFLRASELDPANVEARISLYNYYIMAPGIMGGSEEKAVDQVKAIERIDPFRGHLLRANYYGRKKDTVNAEREIKKAIAAAPEKGGGYKQLGYFYLNLRRFGEAQVQMEKYIAAEPMNADAYDSFADVMKAAERYDQAIEKYLHALAVDKHFAPSIYSLAECYEKKSMNQKAKETYQWFLTVEQNTKRSETAQKKIKEL